MTERDRGRIRFGTVLDFAAQLRQLGQQEDVEVAETIEEMWSDEYLALKFPKEGSDPSQITYPQGMGYLLDHGAEGIITEIITLTPSATIKELRKPLVEGTERILADLPQDNFLELAVIENIAIDKLRTAGLRTIAGVLVEQGINDVGGGDAGVRLIYPEVFNELEVFAMNVRGLGQLIESDRERTGSLIASVFLRRALFREKRP